MDHTIQTRILELRELRRWTQDDLAKKMQMDVKTIYHWESGITSPSATAIIRLCKLFSVRSDYLLGMETNNAIRLDGLPERDKNRFVAMFQVYADNPYISD